MRILLTNDDGILAPGLMALHHAVADMGQVSVVAPASPQSATGHGITVTGPLVAEQVTLSERFWGISVAGRPADCVKLAVRELMEHPPELVLSGINAGANVGINVLYSGTVAAAAEGAILGARAVAFSQATGGELDFNRSAACCRAVLDILLADGIAPGELISVNIPVLGRDRPRGVRVVRQSVAALQEKYDCQSDDHGWRCYWLTDAVGFENPSADSDVTALRDGYITVTPLHIDLTDSPRMKSLADLAWEKATLDPAN
ncbi:MAG: 5'/3'-nucleotidase SurE [Planctomycetes bacterium]|nr:5'/3'-nucleotidase SurE [Planctomycetota bacterium]